MKTIDVPTTNLPLTAKQHQKLRDVMQLGPNDLLDMDDVLEKLDEGEATALSLNQDGITVLDKDVLEYDCRKRVALAKQNARR